MKKVQLVFITLIRILLIWWILTIVIRWIGRFSSPKSENRESKISDNISGIPFDSEIEDADFEEIDEP